MNIKLIYNCILFLPLFKLLEFQFFGTVDSISIIRDILIVFFFLAPFIFGIKISALTRLPILIVIIFLLYNLFLLTINGFSFANLFGVRQNSFFLLLFLIGYFSRSSFSGIYEMNSFLEKRIFILLLVFFILWAIPGKFEYIYLFDNDFRAANIPEAARDDYLRILEYASNHEKYGFYKVFNSYIYDRFYGPYFSPLTAAFLSFFAFVISKNYIKKIIYFILTIFTFTRAVIVTMLLTIFIKAKLHYKFIFFLLGLSSIYILFYKFNYLINDVSTYKHINVYKDLLELEFSFLGGLSSASIAGRLINYSQIGESVYISLILNNGIIGLTLYLLFMIFLLKEIKILDVRILIFSILLIGITSEVIFSVTGFGIFWLWLGCIYRMNYEKK